MPNVGNVLSELEWVAETAQHPDTNHFDRYCDWFDYHQDQKSLEREYGKITSLGTRMGWTNFNHFRRVSSMPLHVFVALKQLTHGEFGSNSKEGRDLLHKFLIRRPEFSVRWHV
jgi:hypothetical protein